MTESNDQSYLTGLTDAVLKPEEGQLSVDVIERTHDIVVRSAIAGVGADDLDVHITRDTITIRGLRHHGCEEQSTDTVHIQECFWGTFSRSIILPCEVDPNDADATMKNGILTITLRKVEQGKTLSINYGS